MFGAPFSVFRLNAGAANAQATFQEPFPQPFPTPETFPSFPAYSPTTATTIYSVAPGFRPAVVQQYSLNVQAELHEGYLLEIGYVGTRGTHLVRQRSLNQALSASPNQPVRGTTDEYPRKCFIASSYSRSTTRLTCGNGIRGQLLVQRA